MLDAIVGQLINSPAGSELLGQIQAQGLTPTQATNAVTATAEGALQQASPGGALAGLLGGPGGGLLSAAAGMLGGAGGQSTGAGGLLSAATGMLGNSGAPATSTAPTSALAAAVPAIAQFVAQKTGLAPAIAQTVVSLALPKVEALVKQALSGSPGTPNTGGGASGLLGGLLG